MKEEEFQNEEFQKEDFLSKDEKKSKKRFIGVERILLDRRLNKEQRGLNTRRELVDRRFESNPQPLGKKYPIVSKRKNVKSFKHKNTLLRLNGIRESHDICSHR